MSEASESAARLPTPESVQYTTGAGSRRRAGQQASVTNPRHRELERVGRFVGAGGSTLAIIGFALPIGSGWFQVDGYDSLLLLLLRGDWADTSNSIGGLGWALIPLVFMLSGSVLVWPITFSLMAEPATQRFPRLSLVVFVLGCLVLWNVVGATFCLAATLGGLVAFVALALLTFRNPARSYPWMYALVPLVGLLAYGGGIALYLAEGVHWRLGAATDGSSLTSANSVGIGFWLCTAGVLFATLGGTLLWQVRRQAGRH